MTAPSLASPVRTSHWLTDHPVETAPSRPDMAKRASRLSTLLTAELVDESQRTGLAADVLITAALGRAVARTLGEGTVPVRVDGEGGEPVTIDLRCALQGGMGRTDVADGVRLGGHAGPAEVAVSYRSHVAGTEPEEGCLLVLHTRLGSDVLYLDWWYDTRGFDTATIAELDEQFRLGIVAVTAD